MKRILTIKPGEGGSDAALFVKDLAQSYIKMATRIG